MEQGRRRGFWKLIFQSITHRSGLEQELASLVPKVESALQQLQRLNLDEPRL